MIVGNVPCFRYSTKAGRVVQDLASSSLSIARTLSERGHRGITQSRYFYNFLRWAPLDVKQTSSIPDATEILVRHVCEVLLNE